MSESLGISYQTKDLKIRKGVLQVAREVTVINGCQGYVFPAELRDGDKTILVQVKRFFEECVDDRGRDFRQNPVEEVENSFRNLAMLSEMGFKVLPFFALGRRKNDAFLLMTDLTQGERVEVYDEKDVQRNRENARKVVEELGNAREVRLDYMRDGFLTFTYGISLGNGTSHMFTRDPRTNLGDVFITDVGEVEKVDSKYRRKAFENGQFENWGKRLGQGTGNVRREFQGLVSMAFVGGGLRYDGLRRNCPDDSQTALLRKHFRAPNIHREVLWARMGFEENSEKYKEVSGEDLFAEGEDQALIDLEGVTDEITDLRNGVDGVGGQSEAGRGFFTRKLKNSYEAVIRGETRFFGGKKVEFRVRTDWNGVWDRARSAGTPIFAPEEVIRMKIDGKVVQDFDPSQMKVRLFNPRGPVVADEEIYYLYKDIIVRIGYTTERNLVKARRLILGNKVE